MCPIGLGAVSSMIVRMRTTPRRRLLPLVLVTILAATAAACSDSDSDSGAAGEPTSGDAAAVEDTVRSFVLAFDDRDAEGFVGLMSANLCEGGFGEPCDALLAHGPDLFLGQPAIDIRSMEQPSIDGDTAQVEVTGRVQSGLHHLHLGLVRDQSQWRIDALELDASPPLKMPPGVTVVEVNVSEFRFALDATQLVTGMFAMHVTNSGTLPHELVIKRVDTDAQLLGPSVEGQHAIPVAGMVAIDPGETWNVVLAEQLPPGHYFIFCEVGDEEGDSHLDHGMAAEFTVVADG